MAGQILQNEQLRLTAGFSPSARSPDRPSPRGSNKPLSPRLSPTFVEGPAAPLCTAAGSGLSYACIGDFTSFTVMGRDRTGAPRDVVRIRRSSARRRRADIDCWLHSFE